jgi:hypothetical protein
VLCQVAQSALFEKVLAAQEHLSLYADVYIINGTVLSAPRKYPRLFLQISGDLHIYESAATPGIDCVHRAEAAELLDDPLSFHWRGEFISLHVDPHRESRPVKACDVAFHTLVVVTPMQLTVSFRVGGGKVNVELQPISGES